MRRVEEGASPAEIAWVALENIEADQSAFDMSSWCWTLGGTNLPPETAPSACGTTLCAAGWIAHSLGWTILAGGDAIRGNEVSHVSDVAESALKLTVHEANAIWFSSEGRAMDQLHRVADGQPVLVDDDE